MSVPKQGEHKTFDTAGKAGLLLAICTKGLSAVFKMPLSVRKDFFPKLHHSPSQAERHVPTVLYQIQLKKCPSMQLKWRGTSPALPHSHVARPVAAPGAQQIGQSYLQCAHKQLPGPKMDLCTANYLHRHQKWFRKWLLPPQALDACHRPLPGFLMLVVKTPVLDKQYRFVYFNIKYLILSSLSSCGAHGDSEWFLS